MFKNKAFQIKMVDDRKDAENIIDETPVNTVNPAEIAQIAADYTVQTVVAVGAVIGAHKLLTTVCDIAVLAAKAKFK